MPNLNSFSSLLSSHHKNAIHRVNSDLKIVEEPIAAVVTPIIITKPPVVHPAVV